MCAGDVAERAERLRVLLALAGEETALAPDDAFRYGLPTLTEEDVDLLRSVTPDDRALANALVAAGREVRSAEYRRLEAVLALLPGGDEPLPGQLLRLHRDRFADFLEAAQGVAELHWTQPPRVNSGGG